MGSFPFCYFFFGGGRGEEGYRSRLPFSDDLEGPVFSLSHVCTFALSGNQSEVCSKY